MRRREILHVMCVDWARARERERVWAWVWRAAMSVSV